MQIRNWLKHGFAMVCLALLAFGQAQAQSSALGRIDEISHDAGRVVIDGNEFTFQGDQIEIVLRGQPQRLVALQVGFYVRYTTDANGGIVRVELIGPPQRVNELLNR